MKKIRAFIAFPISSELRKKLLDVQKEISKGLHHLRPAKPDGIHITLHFLGEITESQVYQIGRLMENVCEEFDPFNLECKGIGGFPDMKFPRVIWAGFDGDPGPITMLQKTLGKELEKMGFPVESRPFNPHLTIFRTKVQKQLGTIRKRAETISKESLGEVKCDTLVLFKSELSPKGAKYDKLKMVALD